MSTHTHIPGVRRAAEIIARDIIGDDTYQEEIAQIIDKETAAPRLTEQKRHISPDNLTELPHTCGPRSTKKPPNLCQP